MFLPIGAAVVGAARGSSLSFVTDTSDAARDASGGVQIQKGIPQVHQAGGVLGSVDEEAALGAAGSGSGLAAAPKMLGSGSRAPDILTLEF